MVVVLKYSCRVICFPISLPAISAVVAIRCGQKCRLGSMDWVQRTLCISEEDKAVSSWKQKAAPSQCNSPVSPAQPRGVGWEMLRDPGQDIPARQQPCPHPELLRAPALPAPGEAHPPLLTWGQPRGDTPAAGPAQPLLFRQFSQHTKSDCKLYSSLINDLLASFPTHGFST